MSKEKLALYGGQPARPTAWPNTYPGALSIGAEEEQAVLEVIRSQNLFRYYGAATPSLNKVKSFEQAFAAYAGAKHALGVTSGTAALMTALAAAGVGPGDEVIIPAYTWIATATAVIEANNLLQWALYYPAVIDPPPENEGQDNTLVRLPCYPPLREPDPGKFPCSTEGYLGFGDFNRDRPERFDELPDRLEQDKSCRPGCKQSFNGPGSRGLHGWWIGRTSF